MFRGDADTSLVCIVSFLTPLLKDRGGVLDVTVPPPLLSSAARSALCLTSRRRRAGGYAATETRPFALDAASSPPRRLSSRPMIVGPSTDAPRRRGGGDHAALRPPDGSIETQIVVSADRRSSTTRLQPVSSPRRNKGCGRLRGGFAASLALDAWRGGSGGSGQRPKGQRSLP